MKIKISDKCNGCGICLNENKYILEDEKGYAKELEGIIISPKDEKRINELCSLCPCKAISVINTTDNAIDNTSILKQMVNELEISLKEISILRLNHSNAPFKVEKYSFDFPDSSNEITTEYSSKFSAVSAARNEFNNLVYGSSARNAQISRIMMDYKTKYGKPYYSLDNTSASFYHNINKSIEMKLNSFINVVKDLGNFNIPDMWKEVKSLPDKNGLSYVHLLNYPKYDSPNDRIWSYVVDLGPTSLNDYVDYMDFDCFDWGDGGFLGMFAKKDWTYSNFDKAVDEFISDLIRAFNYYSTDIEEAFYFAVNSVLDEYEKNLRKELEHKIQEIKKYLSI